VLRTGSTACDALRKRAIIRDDYSHGSVRSARRITATLDRKSSRPGQDVGRARFADKTFERAESDGTKQVCTGFSAWDGEQAYSARLVVTFVASPAAHEVSQAAVVPISDVVSLAPSR